MKQLKEVARMQQLAGILTEIKVNNPSLKINISDDIGEGYNFHSYQNKPIERAGGKEIHAYVDIFKKTFVLWGLNNEELDKLPQILNSLGIRNSVGKYRGDTGIKIPITSLNIIP